MVGPFNIFKVIVDVANLAVGLTQLVSTYLSSKPKEKESEILEERDGYKDIIQEIFRINSISKELNYFLSIAKEFHEKFQELFSIIDKIKDNKNASGNELQLINKIETLKNLRDALDDDELNKLKDIMNYLEDKEFGEMSEVKSLPGNVQTALRHLKSVTPQSVKTIGALLKDLKPLLTRLRKNDFTSNTVEIKIVTVDSSIKIGLSYADKIILSLIPILDYTDTRIYNALEASKALE